MSKPDLYDYVNKVKARIRKMGLNPNKLSISNRTGKKYMYEMEDGKKIHFGAHGLKDYVMYLADKDPQAAQHRKAYRARHGVLKSGNEIAYQVKYSPAWFSWHALW
jgi:hypothetical protein